jgi:hypothetical protein
MTQLPAVEIIGPWLQNKGDVLNLRSVIAMLDGVAAPAASSTFGLERLPDDLDILKIRWPTRWRHLVRIGLTSPPDAIVQSGHAMARTMLSPSRLQRFGVARGEDLAAVLDCSGYAYGDAWTTHRMKRREAYYRRLKQHGAVLVLLPQALGPFEKPEVREWSTRVLSLFDLIYARDPVSKAHVDELDLPDERVKVAPDITHLLEGTPADRACWESKVCVVPNTRMIDRTDDETARRYRQFLREAMELVRQHDLDPVLLIHEKNDLPLAQELALQLDPQVPILDEDALVTKGVLGSCYMSISSRYHAIISALSQGTPVVGTSWSHKYETLFGQYGASDLLVTPEDSNRNGLDLVERLLQPAERAAVASRLALSATEQKARVERMWSEVTELLPWLAGDR